MTSLFKFRNTLWHRRLISLIFLGLFATQMTGVIHAADLDAHDDARPCQICKVLERTGTAPAITATATLEFEAAQPLRTDTSTSVVPALHRDRPPTRAPPR
jgi:hypothetical protein